MNNSGLVRFYLPQVGPRTGVEIDGVVHDVTDAFPTVSGWLRGSVGRVAEAVTELAAAAKTAPVQVSSAALIKRRGQIAPIGCRRWTGRTFGRRA